MSNFLTTRNLVDHLDTFLDPDKMADFGPNGVQIINQGPLTKIATAVSPTLDVITEAVKLKAQALVVHHGLKDIFPLKDEILYKKVQLLMLNNIALIRYHLPLDAHQELGNNWKAAKDLGWQNLEPFGLYEGRLIGVRGTIRPRSIAYFAADLEAYYGNKALVAPAKEEIASVALVSGGAHKWINEAVAAGVDCFVTGTCDEPSWDIAFEQKISFCALGHVATEKVGPKALATYLAQKFSIETTFIDSVNPF